jgi:hypothetical protein
MMGVEVTGLAGMGDNIAFGDGSPKRNALLVNYIIVKKAGNNHSTLPLVG